MSGAPAASRGGADPSTLCAKELPMRFPSILLVALTMSVAALLAGCKQDQSSGGSGGGSSGGGSGYATQMPLMMADDATPPAQPAVPLAAIAAIPVPTAMTDAVAVIQPLGDSKVTGKVTFHLTDSGVKVVADVEGLPAGKHGFHIHEFGDVSDSAKGMSTGGHYDPMGSKHHVLPNDDGTMPAGMHHAGDMGNLVADDSGKAHLEITLPDVSINGINAIVGRGVIVHEKPDDGGQPTGNAGGRIACGVIGVAKGK
jgi:Cu-Zn family superoxide dismutase